MIQKIEPHIKTHMNLFKLYFNTAACFAIALSSTAHAQCADTLSSDGWFIHATDARTNFAHNTLKIMPADERTLWSVGNRILAQPTTDDTEFVIVRSKNIKTSDYRPALGQFVSVIGWAKVDGKPINGAVALKITKADVEITAQDKLLPASCFVNNLKNTVVQPADIKDTAKIIAFINETDIGERNSLIIVDKGRATSIAVGQTWSLIDQNNQLASAQPFGQAQVLQVFDDISILKITAAQHEARLQTQLRYLP